MTYILHQDTAARPAFPSAAFAHVLKRTRNIASGMARMIAYVPAGISAAFAMIYVAPYQQTRDARDPTDPRNF